MNVLTAICIDYGFEMFEFSVCEKNEFFGIVLVVELCENDEIFDF